MQSSEWRRYLCRVSVAAGVIMRAKEVQQSTLGSLERLERRMHDSSMFVGGWQHVQHFSFVGLFSGCSFQQTAALLDLSRTAVSRTVTITQSVVVLLLRVCTSFIPLRRKQCMLHCCAFVEPRHTPLACRLLPESKLEVLNLGDSGMRLIRGGQIVFATDVLQHQFNMPYQLGNAALLPETDTPADAAIATPSVQHGDVIVMGSDGFFDNVWDEDLTRLVQTKAGSGRALAEADTMSLAKALVSFASSKSRDQTYRSPWSVECAQKGNTGLLRKFFPKGGKVDDITVVVAQLQS